jgi:ubiquinone/menaquinone biosynthesis C-methylase UbiE
MSWVLLALFLLAFAAVIYWLLITTEGTYLGSRIVILLYDWVAKRYDAIEGVRYVDEAQRLAIPLLEALGGQSPCRILDLATGTARLPLALARQYPVGAQIIGLDRSAQMLAVARAVTHEQGFSATLIRSDAAALPFGPLIFDAVCCLEALEFMPRPQAVLAEIWRVASPGAVILLSNRVGLEARFYPGRLARRGALETALAETGFEEIRTEVWQVHYDLVWARRPLVYAATPVPARSP